MDQTDNQPQIKQEVKIEDGSAETANPGQKRKGKWENKWKKQVILITLIRANSNLFQLF